MPVFNIADINLAIESDCPVTVTEPFKPFVSAGKAWYRCIVKKADVFPVIPPVQIGSGELFEVYQGTDTMSYRTFHDLGKKRDIYAVGRYDFAGRRIELYVNEAGQSRTNETGSLFYHLAWDKIINLGKKLMFHACCADTLYGGILFSGPSGIGKSTQGELWKEYEHSRIINGDRPILGIKAGRWVAYGSPYAGSSGYHVNASVPIRAIVMLRQAPACSIRRLGVVEAFRRSYAQMIVNTWDQDFVETVIEMTEKLVSDIPVYELACTPDEAAVICLEEVLR